MHRVLLAGFLVLTLVQTASAWDFSKSSIPVDRIRSGGPPKDGIPALLDPKFVDPAHSELADTDRVLGFAVNGKARAYPIRILSWHELVNDVVDGEPILVSW